VKLVAPHDRGTLIVPNRYNATKEREPTHRQDHTLYVRHRLEDLEGHRSLPGRDGRIIERMDEVKVPLALLSFQSLLPLGVSTSSAPQRRIASSLLTAASSRTTTTQGI
jgi:hypothetical protein